MNNARPAGPLDEASLPDGDVQFIGVEERTVFAPPGYVNRAVNCRFRYKRAATRDGITILPWCLNDGLTPFTDVYGGFVFADPNGINEYILVAANGKVYYTRPNTPAQVVPLPANVTPLSRSTFKKFMQVNASILLLRGLSADGTSLRPLQLTQNADGGPDFQTGFREIVQENAFAATLEAATNRVLLPQHNLLAGDPFTLAPDGAPLPVALVAGKTYYVLEIPNGDEFTFSATPAGTRVTWNLSDTDATTYPVTATLLDGAYPIPEASEGLGAQNRTFLISGKDTVAVSDVGDFTRYVPTEATFRINQGDAFTLKYLYLFNESTLLFFKNGNVSKAVGVTGDLSGAVGPLNVTQAYGMAAPSVADIGTDVYWLNSELRITSLNLTELNKEQGTNVALSDPLLRTFGRINPQYAVAARLAVFDGFLHVALPLDDALVLDDVNQVPANTVFQPTTNLSTVSVQLALTPGQTYQWLAGPADQLLATTNVDGSLNFFNGDAVFTVPAAGNGNVYIIAAFGIAAGTACASQIFAVRAQGVNTAVAVYDFLNGAWCGTDESANALTTCVVDWLKFTYNGKQQLAFIGADGFLHLYADGYEDERVKPGDTYLDLFMDSLNPLTLVPHGGPDDILTINGTPVTLHLSPTNSVDGGGNAVLGLQAAAPGYHFWQDEAGNGGFNPAAVNPWTWPANVTVTAIADGIRLVPTNGTLPVLALNGVTQTAGMFTGSKYKVAFYADRHSGNSIQPVPINSRTLTRAYPCQMVSAIGTLMNPASRMDFKRYTAVQLQLAGWSPDYTINTVTQGQGDEEAYVTDETRNYLKFFTPATASDWQPDNSADDFHAPNREDYAYPETGAGIFLGSGVNFDQLQEYTDTVPISERGLFLQLDITNANGRLELVGAALESQEGEQNSGVSVKN